ncbi:hypothetical protein GGF37_004287, partial [Kickxella alabastrina]
MLTLPGEIIKHSSETLCNKEEGTLYITNKRLAWCKAGAETPAAEVLHENFSSQQVSKAEAKKVMLRISAVSPGSAPDTAPNVTHTFTWKLVDKNVAIADRDKYMAELAVITPKKQQVPGGGAATGTGAGAAAAPGNQQGTAGSSSAASGAASASGSAAPTGQSGSEY